MYTVTVTSQGQITLPADLRRKLNIKEKDTLTLTIQGKNIASIEKLPTVLELAGTLSQYAKINEGLTIEEILAAEQAAIGQAVTENYEKELQAMNKEMSKFS